jgi:PAS domain S-box-containing protein
MPNDDQIQAQLSAEVTRLRQQLDQLKARVANQAQTEAELKLYRDHFEELAAERTAEWVAANEKLLQQIVEREWAEEALRQTKQRSELAIKAGRVGVWDLDLWSNEIYLDSFLQTTLGFEKDEITSLDDWMSHVHPDDAERVRHIVRTHFEGGTPHFELEHRMIHQDGSVRWFLVRGSTLRDENGDAYRLVGTNTDITEYKQAETALRQAHTALSKKAADLETANKELAQYAYVVSHDLKAPLRAIHNYADFLNEDLQDRLEGDQQEYLAGLLEAVNEAEMLVDDLLELSRIGRKQFPLETINLRLFLSDLIASLDKPDDAEVELLDPDWPTIETQPFLLRQIFQNLIQNGLKFNQASPQKITLGWRTLRPDCYEIFVRDNGIGIKPQYQERIFQVFQRLHTHDDYPGMGIGLAIVKKATERLQGQVRVESLEGQGSTFFVTLPKTQKQE